MDINNVLKELGVDLAPFHGNEMQSRSPIDGAVLASLRADTPEQVTAKIGRAHAAFQQWRNIRAAAN